MTIEAVHSYTQIHKSDKIITIIGDNLVYHVQGRLSATKVEAVNDNTRNIIREAVIRHSLTLAVTDIHRGAITFDGSFGYFGTLRSDTFLKSLDNFIHDEKIVKLGLQGDILVTDENTENPTMATIRDGKVFLSDTVTNGETQELLSMQI